MITTKQLLELGFKQNEEEAFIDTSLDEVYEYFYEVNLYNEDETIMYMRLNSSWHLDKDNNEWSVYTGTDEVDLEFTDINELKTFIKLVKNNIEKR